MRVVFYHIGRKQNGVHRKPRMKKKKKKLFIVYSFVQPQSVRDHYRIPFYRWVRHLNGNLITTMAHLLLGFCCPWRGAGGGGGGGRCVCVFCHAPLNVCPKFRSDKTRD